MFVISLYPKTKNNAIMHPEFRVRDPVAFFTLVLAKVFPDFGSRIPTHTLESLETIGIWLEIPVPYYSSLSIGTIFFGICSKVRGEIQMILESAYKSSASKN
jgi:hypothetical protein